MARLLGNSASYFPASYPWPWVLFQLGPNVVFIHSSCDEQAGLERMCVDFMWVLLLKIERKKERGG